MHLSRHTDYSLRMLMYLAVEPERLARIADIASGYEISRAHLMKVAQELGALGYVETVRGRGGGVRLGVPPDEIRIGEVVRRVEKRQAAVECFRSDGSCRVYPQCELRHAFAHAIEAFLGALDEYTLADITKGRWSEVAELFEIRDKNAS